MKIVLCNGGLGNQTFQYIFSRFIELDGRCPCYLNDIVFWKGKVMYKVIHNGFEMKTVFPNCKPRLLSTCFTKDVWEYMSLQAIEGKSLIQQMKDAGEEFTLVAETEDYHYDGNIVSVPVNQFLLWLSGLKGNIYYHGYWINKDYLKGRYWSILREELKFAPLVDDRNRRYEEQIESTNSVALHIRRGDFIDVNWAMPAEHYAAAVKRLKEHVAGCHYFTFSDDIPWCMQNRERMGLSADEVTFVIGNQGDSSYVDMQLMSYCRNVILVTASSFSYLAALLNRNQNVVVVNGTRREV